MILDDYGPDNTTGHSNLLAHLVEKGEGFDGGNNTNYKAGTDDEKKASWESFIKRGPETVIKTIVNHEFEGKKDTEKTEMEEKKDGNDRPLDKGKYSDFDEKGIKKYMYEKKIGKGHEYLTKEENEDETTDSDKKKWEGEWFTGGFSGNWRPWLTYGGGGLLIAGVVAAIFWKNITNWWNGPAEEDGKGQVDGEDEKEEEN